MPSRAALDDLARADRGRSRRRSAAFQRVGLVRYNPFEETGGNQSFALALLDADGDGWVLSSLHARSGTRVYAKAITARPSDAGVVRRGDRGDPPGDWPDRLGVTAVGDAPDMAPTTDRSDRSRSP